MVNLSVLTFVICVEWGKGCVSKSWLGSRRLKVWRHTSLLLWRFTHACFLKINASKLRSRLDWAECTTRNCVRRFPVRNTPWWRLNRQSSLFLGWKVRLSFWNLLWSISCLRGISCRLIRSLSEKSGFVYGRRSTLSARSSARKCKIFTGGTRREVKIPGGARNFRAEFLGLNSNVGKQLLTIVPGFVQVLIELFATWQWRLLPEQLLLLLNNLLLPEVLEVEESGNCLLSWRVVCEPDWLLILVTGPNTPLPLLKGLPFDFSL